MAVALDARDLFGGALRLSVPTGWLDTEQFMDVVNRPVPDNQEIFIEPSPVAVADPSAAAAAAAHKPVTLFVDVLEAAFADCPELSRAPRFHAIELLKRDERGAEAAALEAQQEAESEAKTGCSGGGGGGCDNDDDGRPFPVSLHPEVLRNGGDGCGAWGQTFSFGDGLEVVVVRLPPPRSADLVFSLHGRRPNESSQSSASRALSEGGSADFTAGAADAAGVATGAAWEPLPPPLSQRCPPLARLVGSLEVADWGLFGGEGASGGEGGVDEYGDEVPRYLGS